MVQDGARAARSQAFKRGDRGTLRVHLNDEAPRIGSGSRLVEYHVGNRHVTLRNPFNGRTTRLPRSVFDQIRKDSA
jgi:hypothetical protein